MWQLGTCSLSALLLAGAVLAGEPLLDRPRLIAQLGHASGVNSAVLSTDGRLVLTVGGDGKARLWEAATAREVRLLPGHADRVSAAIFSPDGRKILTGNVEGTAQLWDTATGRELHRFARHSDGISSLAFSLDGRLVLTGSRDGTARSWDAGTGKPLVRFTGHAHAVASVAFSPDTARVLTAGGLPNYQIPAGVDPDNTARVWEAATGKELHRLAGHSLFVSAAAFSPDNKTVATGSWDKTARLWNADTGEEIRCLTGHMSSVDSVAFSPDGHCVLTGGGILDNTARLWDVDTGQEQRRLLGHTFGVRCGTFSADGRQVLTASWDGTARLWDADTARQLLRFEGQASAVGSLALSPGGQHLLTGAWTNAARLRDPTTPHDTSVRLWDLTTGSEAARLPGHAMAVSSVAFSRDGREMITAGWDGMIRWYSARNGAEIRRLTVPPTLGPVAFINATAICPKGRLICASAMQDNTVRLWNSRTGEEAGRFEGHSAMVDSVVFSPDSRYVLSGSWDKTARLWDIGKAKEVRRFRGHTGSVKSVAFAVDGRQVLTGSWDGTVRLWDTASGEERRRYSCPHATAAVFSPDARQVAAGSSSEHTAYVWDAATGKELARLEGHGDSILALAFSRDGRWIVTGSKDATVRLWDARSGQERCRLISFASGDWATVDAEGRYDASNGGDVQGLHWVIGNEPITLNQLKARYYEPGLLAKILGFNTEPLRDVKSFTDPELYPDVKLAAPTKDNSRLRIDLTRREGGFGKVIVLVNGKELTSNARKLKENADVTARGDRLVLTVDLADDPRLIRGEQNVITVFALNEAGHLSSRGLEEIYTPPGPQQVAKPDVWAIVAGVSDYRGEAIDLRFAGKDADDFAQALRISASRLFGAEKLRLTRLSTTQKDTARWSTKSNLIKALKEARQAKPADILVVYLAGHGVNHGGQDGDFFYLTSDANSAELRDTAVRAQVALSSQELTEYIKQIPALKQVLILDTCASGRLVQELTEQRQIPSSQVRALQRVKDRTGMYVLAGCAADAVSYEASQYGQGLLTHSLLLGMRGAALRENQFVDVALLFNFASDQVPQLAQGMGGIQRPVVASPRGGASFDIGQVTHADKTLIPLQAPRPLFLRSNGGCAGSDPLFVFS